MILQSLWAQEFQPDPLSCCRLYSDGLGVWFMTYCCCLVEFGSSCFNHAWIKSWFVWFGPWYTTGQFIFFLRWETFYFISYENNDRIMQLTLNCQHLIWPQILNWDRAFFSGTLSLLKRLPRSQMIWQCQQLSFTSFKIKVSHQKSI